MKKILLFLVFLVVCGNIHAQGLPLVYIDSPSVNGTTVDLIGVVYPNLLDTRCWFLLTKDTLDSCRMPSIDAGNSNTFNEFVSTARYLDSYSTYYTTICAENDSGTRCDEFLQFTTGAPSSDNEENKGLVVYPNPVLDQLGIYTIKQQEGLFTISDLSGRVVHQFTKTCCLSALEVENLSAGIYFVTFTTDGVKIVKKFLKQ